MGLGNWCFSNTRFPSFYPGAAVGPLVSRAQRRDSAVLTLGWFGAFRRSELVALRVADVAHVREGLILSVRRSKGDQEGGGAEKGIPYASNPTVCPVHALAAWCACILAYS
jgi:integrase